ncbi:5-formyltetrahydrofolate cyclo-ligase [Tepidibacter formicigenes]|uniref:5-formyltetrahydrofolate cyclo-ligase n=1 Tax=Tepidibacter formicigenes DSM 15518 TaxID=1123349 RepID=A0A1M6SZ30_9FIRM|nr:5-formyltetrahydrofolate cyclo-ligase [Tepidibacter formicigenes]SHK49916.1 5-formyltetrahydrofolate cyclo-ligase [Tepidibacter formicigenes DSM 15518]
MKKEFRKKVLQIRKEQSDSLVLEKSKKVFDNLMKLDEIKNSNTIMAYLDFNKEVKTDIIINHLISLGKKIIVPISIVEERKLLLSEIKDIEKEVKIGTYGIREPKEEYIRPVNNNEIDIVIVPAVAYDINGYRLGYGGGYYDRFLETLRKDAKTIGIAFELQIFDSIPKEEHDAKLNYIITEKRIIKP